MLLYDRYWSSLKAVFFILLQRKVPHGAKVGLPAVVNLLLSKNDKKKTMKHLELVAQIKSLRWELATMPDLLGLMLLSACAATEFAESLRLARTLYPGNLAFEALIAGELEVDNIHFADYQRRGDHSAFLWHFIEKHNIHVRCPRGVREAGEVYLRSVRALPGHTRAMSIVSRERELPGIFSAILTAPGWNMEPELEAFEYYLQQHIALDSGEGGHAELLSSFSVDDSVTPFYEARLEMYRILPVLFTAR